MRSLIGWYKINIRWLASLCSGENKSNYRVTKSQKYCNNVAKSSPFWRNNAMIANLSCSGSQKKIVHTEGKRCAMEWKLILHLPSTQKKLCEKIGTVFFGRMLTIIIASHVCGIVLCCVCVSMPRTIK